MASIKYLNGVLTVLAVLLALQLWTSWAGSSPVDLSIATEAHAAAEGIPDSGAQRQQMIDLLKQQSQKMDKLIGLFESGQARVKLEAAGQE